jgi:hypothetical protein
VAGLASTDAIEVRSAGKLGHGPGMGPTSFHLRLGFAAKFNGRTYHM